MGSTGNWTDHRGQFSILNLAVFRFLHLKIVIFFFFFFFGNHWYGLCFGIDLGIPEDGIEERKMQSYCLAS
jgi:hypothetical protein